MSQVITATYEDGILKPDGKLDLAPGAKVQLVVTPWVESKPAMDDALDEFERLCDEHPIDSGGVRLTRDQLHDRVIAEWANSLEERQQAFAELERFRAQHPINSGGQRLTR